MEDLKRIVVEPPMVYPTLLAAISDVAHPEWRATAMGAYRFWRDMGYALGALISGVIADLLGMRTGIQVVAVLTLLSGLQVAFRMRETHGVAKRKAESIRSPAANPYFRERKDIAGISPACQCTVSSPDG